MIMFVRLPKPWIVLFLSGCWSLLCATTYLSAQSAQSTTAEARLLPGFQLTQLYEVPAEQGSWVSLTVDTKGRLIASDQYGKLYRTTLKADGSIEKVESIAVNTGRAHGLLVAFDSLYVMAHPGDGQPGGLYRVRDTNSDDQYDQVELLREINGEGEHGPHAIVLSPDGQSIYICAGNHTQLPEVQKSRVPRVWQEDQVLTRMWDASGHAVGIMAPGGWIIKSDPDGKQFELISIGYRNEYDIAFDTNGDLFTFDADMEWDIGLPWYRPTRVCHATSGSEFGWRSGTGKWPAYYPDSLPATIDIGPGSPTGIVFGTGSKFPEKYQRALFIADWSYGIIYAVHNEPSGGSYRATTETFCTAPGLAVTDMIVHPNGSLYFMIGGRRSHSAMYRIDYRGPDATTPATVTTNRPALHSLRAELERLHELGEEQAGLVVEKAWPHLRHEDRFIRFAARTAIERMPIGHWFARVALETHPIALLESSLAVVRCGTEQQQLAMVEQLRQLDFGKLTEMQQLAWIRTAGLILARTQTGDEKVWQQLAAPIQPYFPSGNNRLDREMAVLLIACQSNDAAAAVIPLLENSPTQEDQIHYALALRMLRNGWTMDLRERYFRWFARSATWKGGNSFAKFISNIRDEAITLLTAAEKQALGQLLTAKPAEMISSEPETVRPVVKQWTMDDWKNVTAADLENRNLATGAEMFKVGQCYKCHRLSGEGGSVGPDLTAAGRRFSLADMMVTLIDPSKEVSDQYRATIFQMDDGRLVTGRIANLSGKNYMVQTNMLDPGNFSHLNSDQIVEMKPATVSMMPTGLLDTMSREEILDLLAYMRNAADEAMGGKN